MVSLGSRNKANSKAYKIACAEWLDTWQLTATNGKDRRYFIHVAKAHYTEAVARRIYGLMTDALVRWPGGLFGSKRYHAGEGSTWSMSQDFQRRSFPSIRNKNKLHYALWTRHGGLKSENPIANI